MAIASRKGRMNWKIGEKRNLPVGSKHHGSKLTEDNVRDIRASSESCSVLARKYKITPTTMSKVMRGLLWRHVA